MQQSKVMAHVSPKKKTEIETIKKLVKEYPVMGIINLESLPAAHFLKIKHKLRDKLHIRVTKKRLMKIAFDQLEKEKKDIAKVKPMIKGIPALIFTKEDEFKLQKILNQNKTSALAKPGQVANKDIYVKAGATQFAPGPMIGEFGVLGIKTQVLEGKIHIKEDKLLIKEGEIISDKIAGMLSKLGIEPMEIGLNLAFTYKNGEVLIKDQLNISEQEYLENIKKAYSEALNLAVGSCYMEKDTIDILLTKAYLNASALNKKVGELPASTETKEPEKTQEKVIEEKPKEEPKVHEEKKEEIKQEHKEEPKKNLKNDILLKEEVKKVEVKETHFTKSNQEEVADILKKLTDKKIRGEI